MPPVEDRSGEWATIGVVLALIAVVATGLTIFPDRPTGCPPSSSPPEATR